MRDGFAWLEKHFYQVKDTKDQQQYAAVIEQLQIFIDKYSNVIDVEEQVIVAKALEYQLMLYILNNQQEQAERVESILNEDFYGIHKIGKPIDVNPDAPVTNGRLNLASNLLDMNRLKQFAIKQKGTNRPKLLGWVLKIAGLLLIGLAAWLFTINWLWTPLIIGIIGVFLSTIGTQVTNVVNRFFSTIAFNLGTIIPGIIKVEKDSYQALFMAPLMKTKNQLPRWGVKVVTFKKAVGKFKEGSRLAGVCVCSQGPTDYYQDFMPNPVCLGYRNEVIPFKAKQVISAEDWQRLESVVEIFKSHSDNKDLLIVDQDLQKIS
ncbi:DUF3239 domain-containing protein [Entomomonas sp. E2T0]|uniref:DUF3239 domain-containing protein n=1 Tax=Entomomonas sp. E2T0 TaxID=2930213 RepID=UPI0022284A1A|nr:DUF3239 domain-containing protein [Entomomonas sp. E2T0]UYZ83390.1 DUF3239 domain-containing protein [Entomomonas sp. E2T0]